TAVRIPGDRDMADVRGGRRRSHRIILRLQSFGADAGGFVFAKGKMIPAHLHIDRVTEWGETHAFKFAPYSHAHLQQALARPGGQVEADDPAALADLEDCESLGRCRLAHQRTRSTST